jgi:2'-5' RNA ligase
MKNRDRSSHEDEIDRRDWETFRQVDTLTDHWWWRPGWRPDRQYYTWFILFESDARLIDLVDECQRSLKLPYLDLIPPDGLHMTVQGVAFADEVSDAEVAELGARARVACANLASFTLTVGPLAGYSGGVFLRAAPWAPLRHLRARLRNAIATVLGDDRVPDEPSRFQPHISVGYCHAAVPAGELVEKVRHLRTLPTIEVTVDSIHLIEQRRDGHAYKWDVAEAVHLRQPRPSAYDAG